MKNQLPGTNI